MANLFFDTSALVKRYHDEPGTETVDALIEGGDGVVISSLAIVETASAFRRKYNQGHVEKESMELLLAAFFREALEDFQIIPMEESIVQFSFDLVLDADLRTLDSLQLAAALSIGADDDTVTFVSADRALVSTAESRGLNALDPTK